METSDTGIDTASIQRLGQYSLYVLIPAEYVKANGITEKQRVNCYWSGKRLVYEPMSSKEIEVKVTAETTASG